MAATTETAPAKAPEVFDESHVHQTWHVISRNPNFAGETCRLNFSNGEAVLTALPGVAKCPHGSVEACAVRTEGQYCRVHQRVLQLNALMGYPYIYRVKNQRNQTVTRKEPGYRILSEAQYETEFAERESAGDELPDDFKHPGFKAVQSKIAAKSGVSEQAAGAILASATRKASPAARKANPRLNRVKK